MAGSPGAEYVAAVSEPDWKLTLWNAHTGQLVATHKVPEHVGRLQFSPDSAKLATVDHKGDVHLIERATGAIHRIGCGHAERVLYTRIGFSADSTRLATVGFGLGKGGSPDPVSIWDTARGQRLGTFPGRSEVLGNALFSPDGRSLLVSSQSSLRQWRLAPAKDDKDRQPAGHTDEAWSLAFSPDGRTLATGSDDDPGPDPTVKLWDAMTGRLIRAWHGGHGTVAALAYSPDGRTVASGHLASTDNIRIWDAATGILLATLAGHSDRVRAVAFRATARLWPVPALIERYGCGTSAGRAIPSCSEAMPTRCTRWRSRQTATRSLRRATMET